MAVLSYCLVLYLQVVVSERMETGSALEASLHYDFQFLFALMTKRGLKQNADSSPERKYISSSSSELNNIY